MGIEQHQRSDNLILADTYYDNVIPQALEHACANALRKNNSLIGKYIIPPSDLLYPNDMETTPEGLHVSFYDGGGYIRVSYNRLGFSIHRQEGVDAVIENGTAKFYAFPEDNRNLRKSYKIIGSIIEFIDRTYPGN